MPDVVIPLYEGFTALDVVGPYQMLALTPGVRVTLAAERAGAVTDDVGSLALVATAALEDIAQTDVVVTPGGPGTEQALRGPIPLWLKQIHARTTWTTSVCSGSLILGAAGLLDGLEATTHYRVADLLPMFGATYVPERVVEHPEARVITSAGVSSGIDMGLRLVELLADRLTAEAVQLWTEYAPQPPFDSGSPARARAEVRQRADEYEAAARRTGG
ncbi:DJ-1/PfpI family protein [Luteipulveratus sp. YIM 133132]|uniref:DJ-1/PfpI family protein n=1 Tax=Luteipulveratus flavus TaxID=3031728 RepID=UPI0023B12EC2|nr:DJ-1/PfpI family protein [Luteipulveratus sp. YIM 133132]MDE9367653.1 DJ-1/PfpI family protein [Luteipulveratus sp. YIM 133132]